MFNIFQKLGNKVKDFSSHFRFSRRQKENHPKKLDKTEIPETLPGIRNVAKSNPSWANRIYGISLAKAFKTIPVNKYPIKHFGSFSPINPIKGTKYSPVRKAS
jgi:tRNA G10  N-methylase Trm11